MIHMASSSRSVVTVERGQIYLRRMLHNRNRNEICNTRAKTIHHEETKKGGALGQDLVLVRGKELLQNSRGASLQRRLGAKQASLAFRRRVGVAEHEPHLLFVRHTSPSAGAYERTNSTFILRVMLVSCQLCKLAQTFGPRANVSCDSQRHLQPEAYRRHWRCYRT